MSGSGVTPSHSWRWLPRLDGWLAGRPVLWGWWSDEEVLAAAQLLADLEGLELVGDGCRRGDGFRRAAKAAA